MKNEDYMLLMDAMLYAAEGEEPSKAIDNQISRNQQKTIRSKNLPIKTNVQGVPDKFRFDGITSDMDYSERKKISDKNNVLYTKEQYSKMGILIIEQCDDLFYSVELPDGWKIKPSDRLWNDVYDNQGRKRLNFFYKGAFYDRDAFVNFNTRYTINVVPFDDYKTDISYDERCRKPWYGVVYDCDKEIFRTTGEESPDGSVMVWDIQQNQKKLALNFINENYPEWRDINLYWD